MFSRLGVFLFFVGCSSSLVSPSDTEAPQAQISAPATALTGQPVVFDATASTNVDTFAWEFGDDTRGGTRRLPHLFTAPGVFTVKLRARGNAGEAVAQHTITVTQNPSLVPTRMVPLNVHVRDRSGAAIDGAQVRIEGVNDAAQTSSGLATFAAAPGGIPFAVRVLKQGFAPQIRRVTIFDSVPVGEVSVVLREREPALTVDAGAGGDFAGRDGAQLRLTGGSLVDSAGNAVTGSVALSMTPVPVKSEPETFPGAFAGVSSNGAENLLLSWGTVDFALERDGERLNLAPGAQALVDLPMYSASRLDGSPVAEGDVIAAWSLDERTGLWIQEGEGVVLASDQSPTGFAMRMPVSHFSWFNIDTFPGGKYGPKPQCLVDTNLDGTYENLTGTGYCNNAGTNPNAARRQSVVDMPTFYVEAQIPAEGGVTLPIPSDFDVLFTASAFNGLYVGQKVIRGPDGVEERVTIELDPVDPPGPPAPSGPSGSSGPTGDTSPTCTSAVTQNGSVPTALTPFTINPAGATDRFTVATEAGVGTWVTVLRNGSNLNAVVSAHLPDCGSVLGSAVLDSSAGASLFVSLPSGGTVELDVRGTSADPAGYTIQSEAFPFTAATFPFYGAVANVDSVFVFDVAPGDLVRYQVARASGSTATGTIGAIDETSPSAFGGGFAAAGTVARSNKLLVRLRATGGTGNVVLSIAKAEPLAFGSLVDNVSLRAMETRAFVLASAATTLWYSPAVITAPFGAGYGTDSTFFNQTGLSNGTFTFLLPDRRLVFGLANNSVSTGSTGLALRVAEIDQSLSIPLDAVFSASLPELGDFLAMRLPVGDDQLVKLVARSPSTLSYRVRRHSPDSAPFGAFAATVYDNLTVAPGAAVAGSIVGMNAAVDQVVLVGTNVSTASGTTGPLELLAWTGTSGGTVAIDSVTPGTIAPAGPLSPAGFTRYNANLPLGHYVVQSVPSSAVACRIYDATNASVNCVNSPQQYNNPTARIVVDKTGAAGPTNYTLYVTSVEQPVALGSATAATGVLDPFEYDHFTITNGPTAGTGTVAITPVGFSGRVCILSGASTITSAGCPLGSGVNSRAFAMAANTSYLVRIYDNATGPSGGTYSMSVTYP